jgi:hypothetical protein
VQSGIGPPGTWYTLRPLRLPLVTEVPQDPLRFLLAAPIQTIEVISREPEPGVPDSFAMCGLRLSLPGGQICLGTHLSEESYPEVAFRFPAEVDTGVRYSPL